MSKSYKISSVNFGWLGNAFPDKNSISPLTLFTKEGGAFNEASRKELLSQSVIEQDGTISPEVLPALEILANAEAYTRIQILGTNAPVDKVTYFKKGSSCCVDSDQTDFTVTFPAMSKEAGFVLEEFTGSSRFVNAPFETVLSPELAWAFLALVDLIRANALCTLGGKPGELIYSVQEIHKKMEESDSYLWFMNTLKILTGDLVLSINQVQKALDELVKKGLLTTYGDSYSLQLKAMELANSTLIPNYVFHITSANMISQTLAEQSDCYIIFCGMHDILYLDKANGEITIETISGSDLIGILLKLLLEPFKS